MSAEHYAKVLIVEDDPDVMRLVRDCLEAEGFGVVTAQNGEEALEQVKLEAPDILVLDVMLPRLDGLNVCREVRRDTNSSDMQILMLSARGDDIDKIVGLEMGADDYLAKPFNPKELIARVRAMHRRLKTQASKAGPRTEGQVLTFGQLKILVASHRAQIAGHDLNLTPIEFSLLKTLVSHPGRVFTRQELLDRAWGQEYEGDERTVDGHVRNLRAKLQAAVPGARYITAVWRVGYKLE
jgi:two-component system alkaline phosphatase synthesis response regulator PhoP